MKKNKEFTLEQYKKNVANNLNVKEKKLFKKLVKLIYQKGEPEICLTDREYRIFENGSSFLNKFKTMFPFLEFASYSYRNIVRIYPKTSEKEYQTKIDGLNIENSQLKEKLEEQVKLKNINGNKVFELQEKNEKLEMKILSLESKIEGIKNYAKHIGEISYQEYDKDNLAKEENSYYLRDDIEINKSLYFDLADFYCYLGMNDMVRGFKEYENNTREE